MGKIVTWVNDHLVLWGKDSVSSLLSRYILDEGSLEKVEEQEEQELVLYVQSPMAGT